MIAIEPTPSNTHVLSDGIRRRDLSQFLAAALQAIGLSGKVSVLLTGDQQVRVMNRDFRGKDKATDVLSFPAPDFAPRGHVGDLAISLETASRQAEGLGHSLQSEVKILLLHGLLHLAGEDHETDSGEMARREMRLRKVLDLPVGLIERSGKTRGKVPAKASDKLAPHRKPRPAAAKRVIASRTPRSAPVARRRRPGSAGA